MREYVRQALELVKKGHKYIVLELPTGYGKTVAGPHLYRAYRELKLCFKAIHVFPLRTLLHKTLENYTKRHGDIEFTYQDGDVSLTKRGYVKDPYFSGEYVLTTLDSFVHNLFKAPVSELQRLARGAPLHYHTPFANIYPSCVFFDEAHVATLDEGGKAAAALRAAVDILKEMDVPVVVMSATMGEWKREFFRGFKFIEYRGGDDFEKLLESVEYETNLIEEEEVVEVARREAARGRRVLVVVNNIKKAVQWSIELGAVLIHSMLTRFDRAKAEEQLSSAKIVVGTSAIEAGVDVNFDVLITSADSPESVVQRVGRVCRYGGSCRGSIYIFGKDAERYLGVREWRLPHKPGSYASILRNRVEPREDLEWLLRQVAREIYIDPKVLSEMFEKYRYSYVREDLLVEVSVGEEYDPQYAFPASLSRIDFEVYDIVDKSPVPKDERWKWLVSKVRERGDFPILYTRQYRPGLGPYG
ncbi:MAG: CRISPR-associated helicase Cas3' [Pyrobaculum sp.]